MSRYSKLSDVQLFRLSIVMPVYYILSSSFMSFISICTLCSICMFLCRCDLTGCSLSYCNPPNMYSAYSAYISSMMSGSGASEYPPYLSPRLPGPPPIPSYQQRLHDMHKGRGVVDFFMVWVSGDLLSFSSGFVFFVFSFFRF